MPKDIPLAQFGESRLTVKPLFTPAETMFEEFKKHVAESTPDTPFHEALVRIAAMALTTKSNEVADLLNKYFLNEESLNKEKLMLDLGDTLSSWVLLCQQLDLSPEEVMVFSIKEVTRRTSQPKSCSFDKETDPQESYV